EASGVVLIDRASGHRRAGLPDQIMVPGGFSPDGRLIATFATAGTPRLNLWETDTGTLRRSVELSYRLENPLILDLQFTDDGKHLSFRCYDRLHALDIESGRTVAFDRPGHFGGVRALAVSPDGALVASGGDDGLICLWDAKTGHFAGSVEG